MLLRISAFLTALFASHAAFAFCNPSDTRGVPFSCETANTPQPTDLFFGGSNNGSNTGHAVQFTGGQIINMDHSNSPVTVSGGTKTQSLALWMLQLQNLTTTPFIIGGQSLTIGGSTTNQGIGPKLQLAAGSFAAGHALVYDSDGNAIDSGVAPGGSASSGGTGGGGGGTGTGGTGTVSTGSQNQLAYYSANGAIVAGLPTTSNAVVSTNASGAPSVTATLPSGLTIPTPTISSPSITGTANVAAVTATGRVATPASTTGFAGLNVAPGVAPTSPVNGDLWVTSSALNARINGATVALGTGGSGLTTVTANAPLAGQGTSGTPLTCATCATTTSGGALTATAPVTISAAGVISLGAVPGAALVQWPTSVPVTADTYFFSLSWPWATGTITKVIYATGGTTPSFSIAVQVAGTSVTGCSGLTVTSTTVASATCTGANTITAGQKVVLAVTAVSGTPNAAQVQINYTRSAQ